MCIPDGPVKILLPSASSSYKPILLGVRVR